MIPHVIKKFIQVLKGGIAQPCCGTIVSWLLVCARFIVLGVANWQRCRSPTPSWRMRSASFQSSTPTRSSSFAWILSSPIWARLLSQCALLFLKTWSLPGARRSKWWHNKQPSKRRVRKLELKWRCKPVRWRKRLPWSKAGHNAVQDCTLRPRWGKATRASAWWQMPLVIKL